jgi:hypothetical protein
MRIGEITKFATPEDKLPDFGNIEIPVVDWSKNKAMREIGKWLRELGSRIRR